jgi:hypothetical protein
MMTSSKIRWRSLPPRLAASLVVVLALLAGVVYAAVESRSAHGPRASSFVVTGSLRVPLRPGTSRPLNLTLINRRDFPLWITRLRVRVAVDRRHRLAGCSARRDFKVRQMRRRAFPLRLRAHRRRTLRALRVRVLPRVRMRNLRTNQDACKGASLHLTYSARARKSRPRHPR